MCIYIDALFEKNLTRFYKVSQKVGGSKRVDYFRLLEEVFEEKLFQRLNVKGLWYTDPIFFFPNYDETRNLINLIDKEFII